MKSYVSQTKEQRGNEKLHVHRIKGGKKCQDPTAPLVLCFGSVFKKK